MKKHRLWIVAAMTLFAWGCSVQSAVRKSIETVYEASVDERSLGHIITDKKLSGLIMAELIQDDMTNLLDITAQCYFGYPFIVGECNNLEEAQRAIEIARRITDKEPIPFLMKKGAGEDCNPAINLKIATEVKARLVADKKIFATNVVVKSIQCQAVLLGVLGSKEAILAAIEHAENVGGVKTVKSFLVSTDTGRSWDSVFKAMGKKAADTTDQAVSDSKNTENKPAGDGHDKPVEPAKGSGTSESSAAPDVHAPEPIQPAAAVPSEP